MQKMSLLGFIFVVGCAHAMDEKNLDTLGNAARTGNSPRECLQEKPKQIEKSTTQSSFKSLAEWKAARKEFIDADPRVRNCIETIKTVRHEHKLYFELGDYELDGEVAGTRKSNAFLVLSSNAYESLKNEIERLESEFEKQYPKDGLK